MEVIIYALSGRPTTVSGQVSSVSADIGGDSGVAGVRLYSDDYAPCTVFADRPGARNLLNYVRHSSSPGAILVRSSAADLGFTADTVSRAVRILHETGCRYVIRFPEIGLEVTESSGDVTKLLLGITPLCLELQRVHAAMLENYTLEQRPKGRPKFGFYWTNNKYGRWTVRKHPQQHRVRRMILQLHRRGYSGRKIREYLQKHHVSPVPALNTVYSIVKDHDKD